MHGLLRFNMLKSEQICHYFADDISEHISL